MRFEAAFNFLFFYFLVVCLRVKKGPANLDHEKIIFKNQGKNMKSIFKNINPLTTNVFHHIETSQLICIANQLTGFYMIGNIGH